MEHSVPFNQRISCSISEACSATGIGRSKLFQEIAAGRIETRKVGSRTLIIVRSLKKWIDPDSDVAA